MSDTAKKQVRKLKIIEDDPNLSAFESDLNERVRHFKQRKKELLAPGQTLTEFASGHLYYGFHKVKGGWVYREWAPGSDGHAPDWRFQQLEPHQPSDEGGGQRKLVTEK